MKDTLGREKAITVREALELLFAEDIKQPPTETLRIEEAYNRVLAEDIISPEDLPGFDRSTMDGYAVHSSDTYGASESMPVYLKISGEVLMGERADFGINRGEVAIIPTGGMLPEGADAVVMYEYTNRISDDMIEVMKSVAPGENVIKYNEDVKAGEIVLRKGHRLRPQDIGALAGLGITEIRVYKKPVVSIISTGDEIVPPSTPLSMGQVRDINSYNLAGLIDRTGATAKKIGIIRDEYDTLKRVVRKGITESDMVLITGGSSVGTRDFTARVINELGSPGVLFHGVAIKPGKPLIGGIVEGVPVFGLPGHPAAVTVCFDTFVAPLLRRMSGERTKEFLPKTVIVTAKVSRNIPSPVGREDHVRVSLQKREDGLWATPIFGKSGLISTLVQADGVIIIPQNKSGLYEGETVEVRLFG